MADKAHVAEIEKEQDEFRGESRIPLPERAPHLRAPERPVMRATSVNDAPIAAQLAATDARS